MPKPKPGVFRITKAVHNTLQVSLILSSYLGSIAYVRKGVAKSNENIGEKEKHALNEWIEENANRYWLNKGGPLRPPAEGGADIIVVCR